MGSWFRRVPRRFWSIWVWSLIRRATSNDEWSFRFGSENLGWSETRYLRKQILEIHYTRTWGWYRTWFSCKALSTSTPSDRRCWCIRKIRDSGSCRAERVDSHEHKHSSETRYKDSLGYDWAISRCSRTYRRSFYMESSTGNLYLRYIFHS